MKTDLLSNQPEPPLFDFKTPGPPTLPIATHLFTTTQAHPVGLGHYGLSEAFAHGFDGQPPQVVATGMGELGQPAISRT